MKYNEMQWAVEFRKSGLLGVAGVWLLQCHHYNSNPLAGVFE